MSTGEHVADNQRHLSVRGVIIGCIGCIVITATSAYVALKMGALPWPIIFAAIVSLLFLKLFKNTNLHEVNVTHTIMSAGAMVAGGIAFTIPGIWMTEGTIPGFWTVLGVSIAGVLLGCACSAVMRRHFIEEAPLEFPIGEATATTLQASDTGGSLGKKLFGSMAFSAVYTALRDWLGAIPALLFGGVSVPGVAFGIYNSPMLLSVGFLVGAIPVFAMFGGAILAHFGLVLGGSAVGWWDIATGQGIIQSLGMGLMMGCGFGVVIMNIVPTIKSFRRRAEGNADAKAALGSGSGASKLSSVLSSRKANTLALIGFSAVSLLICLFLGLGPIPSILIVLLVWVTVAMSIMSVGQTGIDPMEVFGLIVLLIVAACSNLPYTKLFLVAAIIAVACGVGGDVSNDFRAGYLLKTRPGPQIIGQIIGGLLGAVIASLVLFVLVDAYGIDAFGAGQQFVAAQAAAVAATVSGMPSLPAFLIGIAIGLIMMFCKLPGMMVGLGVYLPFYMTTTVFIGGLVRFIYDRIRKTDDDRDGTIIASGLLGGESIIGVIMAFVALI